MGGSDYLVCDFTAHQFVSDFFDLQTGPHPGFFTTGMSLETADYFGLA